MVLTPHHGRIGRGRRQFEAHGLHPRTLINHATLFAIDLEPLGRHPCRQAPTPVKGAPPILLQGAWLLSFGYPA